MPHRDHFETDESFVAALRDWFAGQALAGIMSDNSYDGERWDLIAQNAYFAADAMLKARSTKDTPL